ncbi:hypothetical protein INR49_030795 [Caranx melampygus]|nr:hypothetical protein INR49_030795 [Caranx melampygus]
MHPSDQTSDSRPEALDTLKMPWTLTRTLTFTLELSPSGWGTTFCTEKHPGNRWKQPQQSPRIVPHVELVLALKLLAEVIYQRLVKVAPTQVQIERCGEDLTEQSADE